MRPFWRNEPLRPAETELLEAVQKAHHDSCFRQNPSFVAIQCAAQGSQDVYKSIAAALMTFGGPHGPILESYDLLSGEFPTEAWVKSSLDLGRKVPGWGMSFVKGEIDPVWLPVYKFISENFPVTRARIDWITEELHRRGKLIYPNPSTFSAATAIILKMPRQLSPYILIASRLDAWAEIFLDTLTKGS